MSVAKLKASNSQVAMKSDEGNESLDTIIRHAIGKEPFLSFSRAGDSPVQWIQLLHALDQPDLPGWPLLSPLKVHMKKCDKCSREFCSSINHRRHIRVDHRPRKLDSTVDRDKLRTFWDELSLDKAMETVSFENATLEEVTGSSIIASLTSLVKKQGFSSLPQTYVKAGSALLGLVQGDFHERVPYEKLFSILDDASEKTFLCGKVEAVQKYVFDGEAGKIDLEKNIVACTSFLVEQKLVKAWHVHKDLEAMEAQESLLLEEDAAKESGKGLQNSGQTRKLKPQKKLKKKEGKSKAEVKESAVDMRKTLPPAETATPFDVYASDSQPPQAHPDTVPAFLKSFQLSNTDGDVAAEAPSASGCVHLEPQITQNVKRGNAEVMPHSEIPSCVDVSVSNSHPREILASLEPIQHSNTDENTVPKAPSGSGCGHAEAGIAHNVERGTGCRDIVHRRQVPSKSRVMANLGFHGTHSDSRAVPIPNVNKVWTPKPKPDFDGGSSRIRIQKEAANQSAQNNKCEVFIVGSIPVTLGRSDVRQQDDLPRVHDDYLSENQMPKKNNVPEKPVKQNSVRGGTHRSSGLHWRAVSRHETGAPLSVQNGYRESDAGTTAGKGDIRESGADVIIGKGGENTLNFLQKGSPGDLSTAEAKAFLAQRWKEAIAANHVKLIQSPDLELPSCPDPEPNSDSQIATVISSKLFKAAGSVKASSAGAARSKSRNPEKGVTTRYIPKDKTTIVS